MNAGFQAGEIGTNRTAGGGSLFSRPGAFCTEIVLDVKGRQTVLDSTAMAVSASPKCDSVQLNMDAGA
jgi:energy-converting hydrogenase Eha subunit F